MRGGLGHERTAWRGVGSLPGMATKSIPITNNDEANRLLVTDPLALLIGMLLDHKVR